MKDEQTAVGVPRPRLPSAPRLYLVRRTFIGGTLDGVSYEEQTPVRYEEGWTCQRPIGGSPYRIDNVRRIR